MSTVRHGAGRTRRAYNAARTRRRVPARRLAALRPSRSDHPTHTLILAFAGSALNTLVIIYAYSMPYLQYMNEYEIGIEIMRGLSGSFGIILTVPFVSFACAALLARRKHQTSVNTQVAAGK
ncbi:MAG: YibE/F family protein [Eggerthellaceae bacterium]|jgi:hypothetical protein